MTRRARSPVEDIEIEYAARPRKPGTGAGDTMRAGHFLYMPARRTPDPPGPPDGSWVNWRETEPWEFGLVVAARLRERRLELALFAGLIG